MSTAAIRAVARLVLAPAWVLAVAVLVKGYASVGDGFAAGAIAAAALLLQDVAHGPREAERRLSARWSATLAWAGLAIALVVATVPLLRGDPIFTHVPGVDASVTKVGSVELITAVAFDVGVALLVLGSIVAIVRTLSLEAAASREAEGDHP